MGIRDIFREDKDKLADKEVDEVPQIESERSGASNAATQQEVYWLRLAKGPTPEQLDEAKTKLQEFLSTRPKEESAVESIFKEADKDPSDNFITNDEFAEFLKGIGFSRWFAGKWAQGILNHIFENYGSASREQVSREEVQRFLDGIGITKQIA